jgi:hypothetical protein
MAQASPQMRLETVEPPHLFDYPARGKVATSDIALLFRGYVGGLYHRNDMALVGGAVSGCPVLLNHRTTVDFWPAAHPQSPLLAALRAYRLGGNHGDGL